MVSLLVSSVVAALVVSAHLTVRRGPLVVISFTLGWFADELPLHLLAIGVVATALCDALGALGSTTGQVGLVLAVGSWVGLLRLAVVAHRSARVVDAALAGMETPVVSPVWMHWWRLVLAVPFPFRSVTRERNIDYWGDGRYRHRLDVITRRTRRQPGAPVLVYIHGGAWVMGNKWTQGLPLLHELAMRGWVCVSVNYRLSPRAAWPAQIVDCKRALSWVREHIAEYGGDPGFLAVSGGSAGGHLSALLALTPGSPEWQPGFEGADTSVDACLPYYGVYDMTGDPDAMGLLGPGFVRLLERTVMKTQVAVDRPVFEQASPDRRVDADAPPMFVVHGTHDTLVPVEVARRFVDRLRALSTSPVAYVELPQAQHAFDLLVSVRCRQATLGAVRFLEAARRTAGRAPAPTEPALSDEGRSAPSA